MDANMNRFLSILNKALNLEYTLIIHYPRLASMVQDTETRKLISELGSASIKHANVVSDTIMKLGGKPSWTFDPFPMQVDLVEIFKTQLEKEKAARDLHKESAYLISASESRERFLEISREEEYHIKTVEKILGRLMEISQG